jgi:hypothetical protein
MVNNQSTPRPVALATSIFHMCPNSTSQLQAWYDDAIATITSRDIDSQSKTALVIAFVIVMVTGALGNSLTCFVVARRPRMRTPLNLLIANLALSDVLLCVLTQPLKCR